MRTQTTASFQSRLKIMHHGEDQTPARLQLNRLFERRQDGAKFSLDGIGRLCAALGHPERDLRFIHIAGTNGKGSVAAMSAAILQEAGLCAGLYTSPHLFRYHERFRINGQDIADADLESWLEHVLKFADGRTFFEISTALALCWFRRQHAQIVVWETGLGGRLDATNIVTPAVSVITSIGMEHTRFLGNTLTAIAREKAGIIKLSIPIISAPQSDDVLDALRQCAIERKAPFQLIRQTDLEEFSSPLAGDHQRVNTALAVAATRRVCPELTAEIIKNGLAKTRWLARGQLIGPENGRPAILVDGAHNPMGTRALAHDVRQRWGSHSVTLVFGALADKAAAEMLGCLEPVAAEVFLTPVLSERSASPLDLKGHLPSGRVFSSLSEAIHAAKEKGRPIVVAGSLFLAAEALQLLGGNTPSLHPNERLVKA